MATYVAESFPLAKGMKGTNVATLQSKIGVTADGMFGDDTEKALKNAYGVTTCSQELFSKIINSNNSNKKGMTLTESTKKKIKIGCLVLGGLGLGYGIIKLVKSSNQKKALNGVRRKRKPRVKHQVLALQ